MSHVESAIGNLPAQWEGHNLEPFLAAFVAEIDELAQALAEIRSEVWLPVAVGIQLDGIGTIVGLGRELTALIPREFFGYADQINALGYGEGFYASGTDSQYADYTMNDEEYRAALALKIYVNTGNTSIPDVIEATTALVGSGTSVTPMGNAHFELVADAVDGDAVAAIMKEEALTPKAAGVKIQYRFTGTPAANRPF